MISDKWLERQAFSSRPNLHNARFGMPDFFPGRPILENALFGRLNGYIGEEKTYRTMRKAFVDAIIDGQSLSEIWEKMF